MNNSFKVGDSPEQSNQKNELIGKDEKDNKVVGPQGEEMQELRAENAYNDYAYQFFFNGDELPVVANTVSSASGPNDQLFYIPSLGVLFYSNLTDVLNAENECMLQLSSGADMTVNEMMKYLRLGSRSIGNVEYYQGDPEDDEVCGDFSFDLAPAMINWNDGSFGEDSSIELIYTINPNRTLRNCVFA